MVILKDFDGYNLVHEMLFDKESSWVRLHNLPLGGMNQSVGEKVGSDLGSLEMVDVDTNGIGWESY